MASVPTTAGSLQSLIRWRDLWWVAAAIAVLIAVIWRDEAWYLNFIHVFAGVLWTGIDLFMGFVIGPILRRLDLSARRQIALQLMPRMLFLMPTLSLITGTAGWFLADDLGYFDLPWPQYGWLVAALVIITILTVQGLGVLMPTNVLVCLELQRLEPDLAKINRWMRTYLRAVAFQGAMQVAIIVIMAKFVTGF
jgi:hypothetical protein